MGYDCEYLKKHIQGKYPKPVAFIFHKITLPSEP